MVTSRQQAQENTSSTCTRTSRGMTQLKFVPQDMAELPEKLRLNLHSHTTRRLSQNLVPKLLEAGLKVIDMSADFRLKNCS